MSEIFKFDSVTYTAPPREKGNAPVTLLHDISFSIESAEFTIFTGPSGAGKSTLLRLFNRLIEPTSGKINFDGHNIKELPVSDLRRRVGMVAQVPVRFPGTVEENIAIPFTLSKENKKSPEEIKRVIDQLKATKLLDDRLYSRPADELSVGEAQRLHLLRALALEPEVLLLDEPTSALDYDSADHLIHEIVRIQKERGLTAIMVSHRLEDVHKVGGTIIEIVSGKAKVKGKNGEVSV